MMTGKEALIAIANAEEVEFQRESSGKWQNAMALNLFSFSSSLFEFRLKPRTITINDKELPKPSFTCHSTSNSNIIEIGFNTEQEARDFHLQFRRAWK
jgi:hypothetical protein